MTTREWYVIRDTATDEARVCSVRRSRGVFLRPGHTVGGPYPSEGSARRALADRDETLWRQLYPVQADCLPGV